MSENNKWPYYTPRWRRLRKLKLTEDPLCAHCLTPTPATQVDHKKPIEQGGDPWEWDNLQSLCAGCHSRKTKSTDKGKPLKGCDVNGNPIDSAHWWNR
jgi:5-methylcytosine-specific restriction endonuclease McrA